MPFKSFRSLLLAALVMVPLSACSTPQSVEVPTALPVAQWDHRPEATKWTKSTLNALKAEGAVLLSAVPDDVDVFCPGYRTASAEERSAFWTGLFSSIARYESTWNPEAKGGGGRYLGLMQISPRTAKYVGCEETASGLYDGASNLACAVKIAARKADRAGVAEVVSDWGPMHDPAKRAQISKWTRTQAYCQV
ncbi:lytic transglycosylase [Haematobacter massiliensis]|uniref:Lytic transglycosylase n=1 Tax=Haematobacter massiliensis TaxID=195105 RepID=A0A086YB38_9RHOB|nr:lytic transglycosylase domain-containing protein [Haematobacter massiliensis]KFI31488.1 lytic transglycosylase [Haematobacter massiliensis]OWJ71614.1 lytic transglycosylase [Haematobacter massiliensis]OWJ88052.1 lytic transglycosylase [Haematobacter massiliensis]QBJ23566.1 lytic transglycosylase [Haematobacter massiliensis]